MKDETIVWLNYAKENLKSAKVLLKNNLYNPSLQNAQQAIEKALKSLIIESEIVFRKTHSISELKFILRSNKINIKMDDDDLDFIDSIYIPSKYPTVSVLPDFLPDAKICDKANKIAENILSSVITYLSSFSNSAQLLNITK